MASGDLEVDGTLTVNEGSTLRDTLFVSRFARLGPAAVQGALTSAGPLAAQQTLSVAEPATFQASVTVAAGNLTLSSGGLICGGEAHVAQQIVAQDSLRLLGDATLENDASVGGDLTVSGSSTTARLSFGGGSPPSIGSATRIYNVNTGQAVPASVTVRAGSTDSLVTVDIANAGLVIVDGNRSVVEVVFAAPFQAAPVAIPQALAGNMNPTVASESATSVLLRLGGTPTLSSTSTLTLRCLCLGAP